MTDLHVLCNELKAMAEQRETPELRQKAEAALNSKWTGVQVCAARVLAKWRGRRSIELLKVWVEKWYPSDRRGDFAMQSTASNILAGCIEPQDANWLLETYLAKYPSAGRWVLWKCIDKISFASVQERLVEESSSDDRIRRLAALNLLIGLKKPQTVRELIIKFLQDPDPEIQQEAMYYVRGVGIDVW